MTVTQRELDLGMSLFLELIHTDPSLAPSVAEARGEYFPNGGVFCGDPRDAPAAEVRFFEWLLFERDHAGDLLVDALLPAWREMAPPELTEREGVFLGTCASIFEVGEAAGEGLYWLRDIAGLGEYAVEFRTHDSAVSAGNLVVGRLFPSGDSAHVLSPGAGCFQEESLLSAVYRDLETARDQQSHKALRIRQVDLEAMFWGGDESAEEPDPVAALRAFLEDGGFESDEIDGLIETLAQTPLPADSADPFVAGPLGELLNHLAFETEIDLAGSQEKFLACWLHLHAALGAEPNAQAKTLPPDPAASLDPREALAAFDDEREAGMDAQTAISRLSARLGVEPGVEGDMAPEEGALGIAIVPALLSEYLWEVEQVKGGGATARLAVLHRAFADLQDVEVLEDLSPRRLLLLGCTFASEATDLTHEQRVDAVRAIGEFCSWCSEQHGLEANPVVTSAFDSLPDSMERICEANDALAADEADGVWQRVQIVDGVLSVLGPGEVGHSLLTPEASLPCLREGDFVRGEFSGAQFSVRWCYPPELGAAR